MFRFFMAVLFGLVIVARATSANATFIKYNFEIFSDGQPGTIEGMFSGDTGDDEVLLFDRFGGDSLTSFMVTFTAAPLSGFDSFTYTGTYNLSTFFFDPKRTPDQLGLDFWLDDFILFLPDSNTGESYELLILQGPGYFSRAATYNATPKVPEPSSSLLFLSGLVGLAAMGWLRRRKLNLAVA